MHQFCYGFTGGPPPPPHQASHTGTPSVHLHISTLYCSSVVPKRGTVVALCDIIDGKKQDSPYFSPSSTGEVRKKTTMLSNCFVPSFVDDKTCKFPSCGSSSRDVTQMRPMSCGVSVVTGGVNGSAHFALGETRVYCSVYGPRANRSSASGSGGMFCDLGILECDVRIVNDKHELNNEFLQPEQQLSQHLKDALESAIILSLYPKAAISIYAVVMNANGGELAALISCASLALADACIEMNDLVCGVTIGITREKQHSKGQADSSSRTMIMDPSRSEYSKLSSVITLTMMASRSCLTHLVVDGRISPHELSSSLELAQSGCHGIRSILVDCLVTTLNK